MGPRCSESAPSCARNRKSSLQKIPTYVDLDWGRSRREAMPNGTPNRSDCALRFSRQSLGSGRLGLKPVVSSRCDTGTKCRTLTTSGQSVTVLAADIETLDSFRPVERAYARAFWHSIASDRPVSVGPPNGGGPRRINHPRRGLVRRIGICPASPPSP